MEKNLNKDLQDIVSKLQKGISVELELLQNVAGDAREAVDSGK